MKVARLLENKIADGKWKADETTLHAWQSLKREEDVTNQILKRLVKDGNSS